MTYGYPQTAEPVGVIEGDVACRKCGYNLRGLDVQGRCPECGTAVGYSIRGDLLRFSDPDWLRGMRRGIATMLVAIGLLVAGVIAVILLVVSAGAGATARASSITVPAQLAQLAIQGLLFAGIWQLTAADPSGLGEDDYGGIRRFIRIAILTGLAANLLGLARQTITLSHEAVVAIVVAAIVVTLVGLAGWVCQLLYLGRLARRLPDPFLAQFAKAVAWMLGISYGLSQLLNGVMLIARSHAAPVTAANFGGALVGLNCASGLAGLAALAGGVMYIVLLVRFAARLKLEEATARQTWAAAPPPQAA